MSKPLKFYWIDDFSDRRNAAENLAYALGWESSFVDTNGRDLLAEISNLVKETEPGLIILDHKLQNVKDGLYQHGSTAAAIIREKWPYCPIVCVSGVDAADVTIDQRALYEAVFPISSISNNYPSIASITYSFQLFRDHPPKTIDELLHALGNPADNAEKLKAIIPPSIKDHLTDLSVIRPLSGWIRNVLFERPGFLYDPLWAATFIGISENSFIRMVDIFNSAFYTGLFHNNSKPRWWKSGLLNILSRIEGSDLPWQKGRQLPGVRESDYSKCVMTGEAYPETVGFLDSTYKERYPMKLKVTVRDDNFQDLLYFEDIRKYNEDHDQ